MHTHSHTHMHYYIAPQINVHACILAQTQIALKLYTCTHMYTCMHAYAQTHAHVQYIVNNTIAHMHTCMYTHGKFQKNAKPVVAVFMITPTQPNQEFIIYEGRKSM